MKTRIQNRPSRAFTLVEMVGVLAVIAILASMLTPKIFSAINDARLGSTVSSLDALKGSTVSYYSKNGNLPLSTEAAPKFDKLLVTAEFLERPFECRIGSGSLVQCVAGPAGLNGGYLLDGTSNLTLSASSVVQCLISNVTYADAWELSMRVDGTDLSMANAALPDTKGRVVYNYNAGILTTVYIYVGHR